MSKRYPGNFITGNPVALSQTSNNGIWDVTDVSAAVAAGTWQEPDGIYEIPKSLRFRSSATAYLNRTPTTAGNRRTWTWSGWVKRGSAGGPNVFTLFFAESGGNTNARIEYLASGQFRWFYQVSGVDTAFTLSNALYRDYSAWYHVVYVYDSTQATAANRQILYVNGVQTTNSSVITPAQNTVTSINDTVTHWIGRNNTPEYFDGYMAEVNFIDGQALDPSYFGYFDNLGIWQPKRYTGSYGTNGFYLPFTENGSTLMLGKNAGNPSNLVTYSEQLDNGAWGKPAAPVAPVVTANQIVAPDGTTTADLVTFAATAHPCIQEITVPSFTIGDTYTASIYLKTSVAGTYNLQLVYFLTAGGAQDGYCQVVFNSSGVLTSAISLYNSYISSNVQYVGNGWYRVSVSNRWTIGGAGTTIRMSIGQGSGASSIYAWGGQINLGERPDSYIQTVASAVNQSWTPNNFSLTANTTYDSMVDSPTNVFTTATDIGGVVSGNYATLNPLTRPVGAGGAFTIGQGNLQTAMSYIGPDSTIAMSSGKWYWEVIITGGLSAYNPRIGIVPTNHGTYSGTSVGDGAGTYGYTSTTGQKGSGGTYTAYGAAYAENDVIGVALDMGNGTLTFYKNGVSQGVAYTGITGEYYASVGSGSTGGGLTVQFNFGQRPFAYAPPAGFKSLNTTNIQALGTSGVGNAAITPHKWFDINLYAGTGTVRDIQNSGFQPDIVWIKKRSGIDNNEVTDSARGDNLRLASNATDTESAGGISIRPNGFNLQSSFGTDNESGYSYIAWQWKQSPTAGLNVISYTGDGTNNRAISHNLNATPAFIITKNRDQAYNWDIYHQSLDIGATMTFNSGLGSRNVSAFGTTAPTSSNFYTQNNYTNTSTNKYVAYLWAEIPGFSKFGSFPGNSSSDGPFAYCGFRPKIVIIRSTSASREWNVWDTARGLFNLSNISQLDWGQSHAEYTTSGYNDVVDFLSNGFKLRSAVSPNYNQGETYVWAAFAESPFGLNNRAR